MSPSGECGRGDIASRKRYRDRSTLSWLNRVHCFFSHFLSLASSSCWSLKCVVQWLKCGTLAVLFSLNYAIKSRVCLSSLVMNIYISIDSNDYLFSVIILFDHKLIRGKAKQGEGKSQVKCQFSLIPITFSRSFHFWLCIATTNTLVPDLICLFFFLPCFFLCHALSLILLLLL